MGALACALYVIDHVSFYEDTAERKYCQFRDLEIYKLRCFKRDVIYFNLLRLEFT